MQMHLKGFSSMTCLAQIFAALILTKKGQTCNAKTNEINAH